MSKRAAARKALQKLWNGGYTSDEEEVTTESGDEHVVDCVDVSEESSEEDETDEELNAAGSSAGESATYISKDGTVWTKTDTESSASGRPPSRQIFTKTPGIKPFARSKIDSESSAWRLLFTPKMLKQILDCTIEKGEQSDENFSLILDELEAFIGLLYLRGVLFLNKADVHDLFSSEYGVSFFNETMSRNKFVSIMKHLRFDKKSTRCNRVSQDPFTHIRELYDDFVENSKYVYQPHPYLTVDEQLLPSKNHCNFLQFMASKPDKYGIKEWVLVDVKTKYCVNQFPYLGKDRSNDSNPSSTETMGSKIVKQLIEPWENCGYHITADNFFTSAPLAKYLLEKNTTFLGTLRPNSRSIARDAVMKNKELYQSDFFESDGVLMVNYQCKVKKSVSLLSTMHCSPKIITEHEKKKPEMVVDYNKTKTGVDTLDQMLRTYSTKAATRRWPICVFYDLLNKAAINAHVLYCEAVGPVSRKRFLHELSKQLCQPLRSKRKRKADVCRDAVKNKQKRVTCSSPLCENKTFNFCDDCDKAFCGKHGVKKVVQKLHCSQCACHGD